MKVLSIQPTPNPLAFKFIVDQTLQAEGSRYYNSAAEAAVDPLSTALFAVPGVSTTYFAQDFVTVTSAEGANLETLHQQVRQVLETHTGGTDGVADAPISAAVVADDAALLGSINGLLDDRVRPALAGDGGGLQITRLENKVLTIQYEGACGTCPSSIAGTLSAIQNLLQMEVDEELTVVSATH
jgi:Fe-S cluster biogenesis protein NfuA